MRFAYCLFFLLNLFGLAPAMAGDNPAECDSCRIQIDNLDHPFKLNGKWLFTRDDSPQNKNVILDTSTWRLVKAPGPWKGVYDDKSNFDTGWYRGNFEFNPSLIGQEVVLLVNTYMGRVNVYVDGEEVYRRPNNINVERYYSTQAIPVRFTISQPHQVIAIRVETPLMIGVYQMPFELRKYDEHDVGLVAYQILGGEARQIISYVVLLFGFFFILVYSKTRYALYLVCALCSILIFPFFAGPGDYFLSMFSPETMLYLHYPGMFGMFLFYIFTQFFYKFTPKINWIAGTLVAAMGLTIGSMAFHPNLDLFQHLRGIYFLSILLSGFGATFMLIRGVQHKKPGAGILLVGEIAFVTAGFNDFLLTKGAINSYALIFYGGAIDIATMLYVASNNFANTFVENKSLAKNLKVLNENLENLVRQRTAALEAINLRLADMAVTDELTGAYNRRHFNAVFGAELSRRSRSRSPMAFCILDIDNFKLYNDTYGHQAGDEVLQRLSQAVRGKMKRAGDEFFRLGGEEFGILLIGNEHPPLAQAFVESIRETIEKLLIPHAKSPHLVVTASFGLVLLSKDNQSIVRPEDIYVAADNLLYQAKENGRNCVVVQVL